MEGTTPAGGPAQSAPATNAADPSPATTHAAPVSEHDLMLQTMQRGRQGRPGERSPQQAPPRAPEERTSSDAASDTATRPKPEDGKSAAAESETGKKKHPESIPFPAFQERLGREQAKTAGVEAKLADTSKALLEHQHALTLMKEELRREREARQQGLPYDEQQATIGRYELAERARQARETVDREHAATLQQQQTAAKQAALVDTLREEFASALSAYDHLHPEELREAWEARPEADAMSIAKELHQAKLERMQRHLPKAPPAPPPTPATARRGPAGAAPVFADNEDGMLAWMQARR